MVGTVLSCWPHQISLCMQLEKLSEGLWKGCLLLTSLPPPPVLALWIKLLLEYSTPVLALGSHGQHP